jgi:ABC transporter transmembrane region 2
VVVGTSTRLALEWREWMTRSLTQQYFQHRTFYSIQAGSLLDNPDQRISSDVRWGVKKGKGGALHPDTWTCWLSLELPPPPSPSGGAGLESRIVGAPAYADT